MPPLARAVTAAKMVDISLLLDWRIVWREKTRLRRAGRGGVACGNGVVLRALRPDHDCC
jgi:hypothetical protein